MRDPRYPGIEFFAHDTYHEEGELAPGWYWWGCFPGCLPDGDPIGPFDTAEAAADDYAETCDG